jgi:Antirepressor regulating drug resistance, predicted signal transduction N-terminal membrane component
MVQSLFQNIFGVTLAASAVIALLLLLLPSIRKNYTVKWRYWVWLALAIRLMIPFSPSWPQTPIEITPPPQNITINMPARNTASPPPPLNQPAAPQPEGTASATPAPISASTREIPLGELLSILWVSGTAVFLLYHFAGYLLFRKSVLRFSKPIDDPRIEELWHEAKEEMKISRGIRLLTSKKVQSPMMTGFFKPLLILPDPDFSDADLKIILKHELIHYKRKDVWYKLLLVCANAVHWFNPLVYLMKAESNRDIEMVCDSELIRDSDAAFRKQYSEAILSAIHKGNLRQTTFSTYFYGGKRAMKERFANIFDGNKKRRGILSLCAVIAVVSIAGTSVAYGAGSQSGQSQKAIDNISLLSAGNSFDLEDEKFVITYGGGKSTAVVPLEAGTGDQAAFFSDKAVYLSDEVTAVAYGGTTEGDLVKVLISNDMGKTWNSYPAAETKTDSAGSKFVGFTTKTDGWLVTAGDTASGYQRNRIFETADGGKTWTEIGNTSDIYPHVVTGAGFTDSNTGFVSFRYDTDSNPVVYRTEDRGKTWTKCSLEISGSFKKITSYATAFSPVFNGANGILPATLRNNDGSKEVDMPVRYVTADSGKTWTFDEKQNMASLWGDALKTRDGMVRYEIMSAGMQKDFLAERGGMAGDPFVIGQSSPWVQDFSVAMDGGDALVTYWYTESTGSTFKSVERLTFGEEDGRTVVAGCQTVTDMEEYSDTSDWKRTDAGTFTFSAPKEWSVNILARDSVSFKKGEMELGSLTAISYDPKLPLSQLEGNHAQTLSTKPLEGCRYPATEVMLRRTQPAAANDDSYVKELHIYLIPQNGRVAYDLSFDSSQVNEKAIEIARTFALTFEGTPQG